jgi:hypothetical protein
MEGRASSPAWRAGRPPLHCVRQRPTTALKTNDCSKKSGPISEATIQRGRKAGSQGRLCKVSFCKAERRFGSCREQWVVVKVISSKRPLLLIRIYALPEPKEFVTTRCDARHRKCFWRQGLKLDQYLRKLFCLQTREAGKMHNAAHSLQSTASHFRLQTQCKLERTTSENGKPGDQARSVSSRGLDLTHRQQITYL